MLKNLPLIEESLVKIPFMNETLYAKITDALVKDGYIIIENALDSNLSNRLLDFAKIPVQYKRAGISSSQNVQIDLSIRGDKTRWLDEDGGVQSEYLDFAHGFQEYLNRTLFLVLTYYEAHFALYESGAFYEKHYDAFQCSRNRLVTTVYYLNDEWQSGDGGELVIYDVNDNQLAIVEPKMGTLVVFMSEEFPHEVLPAVEKRHSIAGWFRIDKPLL